MKDIFQKCSPARWSVLIFAVVLAGLAAGCRTASLSDANAFASPTGLTARLATPLDIDLTWKDNAKNEAGYFVEYSPEANDEYVIIEALPPGSTKYRHPHLLPNTRFVFRIVPFFGPASNAGEIVTGKQGPQQNPPDEPTNAVPDNTPKVSLRSMATFAQAAPTGFKATLIPPAGAKLEWKNHASDADGILLEIKPPWSKRFIPSAFLSSNQTSQVTFNFPLETKFELRVRPIFYGKPSNSAGQTTGDDPTMGGGTWKRSDVPENPKPTP